MLKRRKSLLMAQNPNIPKIKIKGVGKVEWERAFEAKIPSVVVKGEGKQDGTPTPDNPIEPVFLEGASVGSRGRNLVDPKKGIRPTARLAWYYKKDGIQLIAGKTYIFSVTRIASALNFISVPDGAVLAGTANSKTLTCKPAKTVRAFIQYALSSSSPEMTDEEYTTVQLEIGSTPTPYTPYYDGGTAPLPILRALPDGSVRDEDEVISGTVMRSVGVFQPRKAFGGDAKRVYVTAPADWPRNVQSICTHFTRNGYVRTDVLYILWESGKDAFNSFLEEERANNRPVTFYYTLATPIIEHYDPAILRQHPGYTQLIQQGGFREAEIEADVYTPKEA